MNQQLKQKKIAFGSKGHPFTADYYGKSVNYEKGICPVAEKMWFEELFFFYAQNWVPTKEEISKFSLAVEKILKHKTEIEEQFGQQY